MTPLSVSISSAIARPSARLASAPMVLALALSWSMATPTSAAAALPADASTGGAGHPAVVATAPLWQPPEGAGAPKRPRKHRPPPTPRDTTTTTTTTTTTATNKSTEALEKEVFGPESATATRRSPARDDDDEIADDVEPYGGARARAAGNLPAIIAPHLISFDLGTAVMTRSFHFDAPLQPDDGSVRGGVVAELESFPLLSVKNRWIARLGLGASFGTEIGNDGVGQADGGTLSYKVTERRWSVDVRYALPLGERFLLVPLVGYGHTGYDLARGTQPAPSTCIATSTQVCLPDVQLSHLTLGLDARFAFTPSLAASLAAAYLPGFGLGRGTGQLGVESDASAQGLSGTLAVSWQLLDWLALRAAVPIIHYSYAFSRRPLAYTSASETYYGVVVGATVFTR
jgi:hypothetical protein